MNRSLLKIGAVLISSATLLSCGSKKDAGSNGNSPNQANAVVPVNLDTIHPQHVLYYDQYPGTVVALMQVDIRPEVEGYVTGIFFKEGDHVKKGQMLYEIDKSKYQATYDQAKANVRVAEANLDQSQKDADRYIYLNQHDAVAKQILDHSMTTLQNSKNQVTAAKQDLNKAQTDLNYAIIKAPFDGTIGISQVKLGNTVTVGQTVLNTISTDDPMTVDFVVNEKQIPRFIKLKAQKLNPSDSIFTLLMPDNLIYGPTGEIYVIDRGVDPQSGTIRVRLKFPNVNDALRAGMSCTVRVHNEDTSQQLIVPSKAIVEQMGEYFVFVAKDTVIKDTASNKEEKSEKAKDKKEEKADGPVPVASQKKVLTGQTIGSNVIIKSGLKDGDRVVVDGVQKLREGTRINPAPPKQAGAPGGDGKQGAGH